MGEAAPQVSGRPFLSKPYRRDELARVVREALDPPRPPVPHVASG
jgi:hypothetical protein